MPMDPAQPEYTKSFTADQVEEYLQVSCKHNSTILVAMQPLGSLYM